MPAEMADRITTSLSFPLNKYFSTCSILKTMGELLEHASRPTHFHSNYPQDKSALSYVTTITLSV